MDAASLLGMLRARSTPSPSPAPFILYNSHADLPLRLQVLETLPWEAENEANQRENGDDGDKLAADEAPHTKPGNKRKHSGSVVPSKGKAKNNKAAVKSKAVVGSEDEAGEGEVGGDDRERASKKAKVKNAALQSDPEAVKVLAWRHKLQKTFLTKALSTENEMPAVDTLFTTIERYQNMNIDILTLSRIGKVMRHIHLLEPAKVPCDDKYKFRSCAKALVDKWRQIADEAEGASAAVAGVEEVPDEGDIVHQSSDSESDSLHSDNSWDLDLGNELPDVDCDDIPVGLPDPEAVGLEKRGVCTEERVQKSKSVESAMRETQENTQKQPENKPPSADSEEQSRSDAESKERGRRQ
ncbi:hypothetical protein B0H13DRAFT_1929638 [Mycena leptocephala]|nr:hypothetical protein B0H13DRAFT_1929638 [Mycena leptocephala]